MTLFTCALNGCALKAVGSPLIYTWSRRTVAPLAELATLWYYFVPFVRLAI